MCNTSVANTCVIHIFYMHATYVIHKKLHTCMTDVVQPGMHMVRIRKWVIFLVL